MARSRMGNGLTAEFISIAEERGLVGALGEWVLAEACRQVRRWQERKCPLPGRVAVNVAARQFEDDDFIDRCLRIARETGTTPSAIELELTESGMVRDPERAVEITRALASAGFALSIDDFGTGYSSLTYLKRFPVHKLKIDISFARDMLNDRNDYSIVSTIIAMSKSMELETLAEVTCSPKSVPGKTNKIRATQRKRDAQEQVHGRADHRVASGNSRQNRVLPCAEVTLTEPPWACMMARVIANPSPAPSVSGCDRDGSAR